MSITLRAKRILTGALAGALVLGLLPAGVASANTDVCDGASSAGFADADATHQANIDCAVAYGIVSGQAGNVFNASGNMTRGQMATALVNFVATAKNVDVSTLPTGANSFEDVAGTTHEANIARAFAMGIIQGRSATVFDPGSRITRGAAATMIANAHVSANALNMDLSGVTPATNFTDVAGSVHAGNINVLAGAGVITGTSATTFSPNRAVTRGQTVTLLMGAANKVVAPAGLWNAPALSTPSLQGNIVVSENLGDTNEIGSLTQGADEFIYSDGSKLAKVKLGANDVFFVDGVAANEAAFTAALSRGDAVTIQKDTPATGRQTISLTNRTNATFYTTGMINNVDSVDKKFDIIEPVSGVSLNAVANYAAALTTYQIDGAPATLAQFDAAINDGDVVTIGGTSSARVYSLSNRTVTGKVKNVNITTKKFKVTTGLGLDLSTEFEITADSKTVLILDGTTVTPNTENRDKFVATAVRDGDTISVSRNAGVLTVSVTRVAPAAVSGVVGGGDADLNNNGTDGAGDVGDRIVFTTATEEKISEDKIEDYNFVVDGSTVSAAVFLTQLTVGDAITILEKDPHLRPKGTVTLTNQSLSGPVDQDSIDAAGEKFKVALNAATTPVLTAEIDSTGKLFGGADPQTYSVNGAAVNAGDFHSALKLVKEGTRTASIVIARVGNVTNYALTTVASSAATFDSVAVQNNEADVAKGGETADRVVLEFSQPVRFNAALAAGDFVITRTNSAGTTVTTISAATVTPITPGGHDAKLVVTFTGLEVATGDVVKVELTAQGAAKVADKNGTAATAGNKSVTVLAP